MTDKQQPTPPASVDTGGGAYIGGNVDTGGGAFAGRDQTITQVNETHGVSLAEFTALLAELRAALPAAGLDAVLVAVELALESAPPSGRVSAEHVVNVLARLNAVPRPANVATMLQVLIPPIADTARYDRLRNLQEADHEA